MKKEKLFSLIFWTSLFLTFFLAPKDTDLGWHLRYGQSLIRDHRLIRTNEFTVFLPNFLWANSYTGYQALVYIFYHFGGLWGLTFLNLLLMSSAFYLFYLIFGKKLKAVLLSLLFIFPLSWTVFFLGIRAQLFSILWLLLTIYLLQKGSKITILTLIPLLTIIWVNTHGAFPFIYLILGCFALEKIKQGKKREAALIVGTTVFSLIASLFNPYGPSIFKTIYLHLAGYDLSKSIAEWTPPPLTTKLVILASFLTATAVKFKSKKPANNLSAFILAAIFAPAALKARRNLPFYALSLTIGLKKEIRSWADLSGNLIYLLLPLFLVFGFLNTLITIKTITSWSSFCASISFPYPCKTVDYIRKEGIVGNFFHNYEWGGFLEWQLPNSKFFIDGRMSAWPTGSSKDAYHHYLEIIQAKPDWQKTLNKYQIQYLLITKGSFLDLELRKNPGNWQLIFEEKVASLWKKI